MVKPAGPGIYSATYSNVPVYEFQFGEGLKEHVMRRRGDNWINATHILKAAGFDKPARTRILEREVQKETHEKVQGGYGKYQGTWVPLDQGRALALRNNVYEKLKTIFEFNPGDMSPPPAPKHTTAKPKVPKKPAVPKWPQNSEQRSRPPTRQAYRIEPVAVQPRMIPEDDADMSSQMNDDESMADDITVASASFIAEDDRYDMSQPNTGHRKRKREEQQQSNIDQAHVLYSDELLDYFLVCQKHGGQAIKPEPPINFKPDWLIDSEGHTALHWAASMGDVEVMRELKRFGATISATNIRGETPLMRSTMFTNALDKQTMPIVVKELMDTIACVDLCHSTVLHHAAAMTHSRHKHQCARYYLDVILNKMQEVLEPVDLERILDARDTDGNTAVHIAAHNQARKCVRALMGRGARTDIPNNNGITADELIRELNQNRKSDRRVNQGSSSPYLYPADDPEYPHKMPDEPRRSIPHVSEAAMAIEKTINPAISEKLYDLARSFDDELTEKDTSEREARRILSTTQQELDDLNTELLKLAHFQDTPKEAVERAGKLEFAEKMVISVVEQQQKMKLWSRAQQNECQTNGHITSAEDDLAERVMLAKMLQGEQKKRQKLMIQFRDALSKADNGPICEKGDHYRRLIYKTLGHDPKYIDENIDTLIAELSEEHRAVETETRVGVDN